MHKYIASENYNFDFIDEYDTSFENYKITFSGDMANPCELSIQEMIDMFGTETRVMKAQCVVNGVGNTYAGQVEVTGIPANKIYEYLQVDEEANGQFVYCLDGYSYPVPYEDVVAHNGLLVFEMNGEPLPDVQGFPIAMWYETMCWGKFEKHVTAIEIVKTDPAYLYPADYHELDWDTGDDLTVPNIAVVKTEQGQIFEAGKPIHLEGFSDAISEQVIKMEFSFDRGKTWIEIDTSSSDVKRWIYWNLDLDLGSMTGSFVLEMRATSIKADGTTHTSYFNPQYFFNVQ